MEQFCLFCYKSTKDFNVSDDETVGVLKNFLKQIRRYFMLTAEASGFRNWVTDTSGFFRSLEDGGLPIKYCAECFSLVEHFCYANNQWMRLQLEMDWIVFKLKETMRLADAMPSLVKSFQEGFCDKRLVMERIMNNRLSFKKLCKINQMARFPRVSLVSIPCVKRENRDSMEIRDEVQNCATSFSSKGNDNYYPFSRETQDEDEITSDTVTAELDVAVVHHGTVGMPEEEFDNSIKTNHNEKEITNGNILIGKMKQHSKMVYTVSNGTKRKDFNQQQTNKLPHLHPRKTVNHSSHRSRKEPIGNVKVTPSGLTVDDIVFNRKCAFICEIEHCGSLFREKEDLIQHSKLHGNFPCSFCEDVKSFAPDLSIHEMSHAQGSSITAFLYCCARCNFQGKTQSSYIEHHLSEHLNLSMDKRKCPICRHCYGLNHIVKIAHAKARVLKHYVDMHNLEKGDIPRKCNKCPAFFKTILGLREHKREIHGMSLNQQNKCDVCNFSCGDYETFFEHQRNAHKYSVNFDSPHACTSLKCGARFEKHADLEYHIWTTHGKENKNVGVRRFICVFCSRTFCTRIKLYEHIKKHTKECPFICHICGDEFSKNHVLKRHVDMKHFLHFQKKFHGK